MKNQRLLLLIILCLVIITSGCSQIYDPSLESQDDILVVEAHMTDNIETYSVTLSLTSPFNSSIENNPVSGAKIRVIDENNGSKYNYSETSEGFYLYNPNSADKGVIGHSYTLYIETAEGDIYCSTPQAMNSPVYIDSLYGIRKIKTEMFKSPDDGSVLYKNKTYIDIITDIRTGMDSTPRVRFEANWIFEMIDYHRDVTGGPPVPPTYSWKYSKDLSFTISESSKNNLLKEQNAGSILVDNLAGLYEKQHLEFIVLVLNYFSLNNDSYNFLNDMKKQLSGDDVLFDPMSLQIKGNMKCLNNPEKQVKGLFDVASHRIDVFFVNPNNVNSPPTIIRAGVFRGLPARSEGKTEGIPPYWWFGK
jgi:hypothetical protein